MKITPTANQVQYTTETGPIVVARLSREEARLASTAAHVLSLVMAAYKEQFERPWSPEPSSQKPLAPNTVRAKYGTPAAVAEQQQRLTWRTANGGAYWVVRQHVCSLDVGAFDGLANTTPSRATRAQRVGVISPNCYLGNVITRPVEQERGIGSAVMHAALKFGGYDPKRLVVADVLTDNERAPDFFEHRGLHPEPDVAIDPLDFPGEQELPQVQFSGRLLDVLEALEAHVPMLASAEVIA